MSKFWEKVFFIFTYITQGSSYMSPRAYGIMHRMHHAYTDTEMDPHSPKYSKNVFQMMWRTRKIFDDIFEDKIIVEEGFTKNLPDWPRFDRWAHPLISRVFWAAAYLGNHLFICFCNRFCVARVLYQFFICRTAFRDNFIDTHNDLLQKDDVTFCAF
jgi:stearoyl-CoA desaturase (delta-9 desaturase)